MAAVGQRRFAGAAAGLLPGIRWRRWASAVAILAVPGQRCRWAGVVARIKARSVAAVGQRCCGFRVAGGPGGGGGVSGAAGCGLRVPGGLGGAVG